MIHKLSNILNAGLESKVNRSCGYGFFQIAKNWSKIVGQELSHCAIPEKIVFFDGSNSGVLYVKVQSGAVGAQILFLRHKIIDELRLFLGYNAINEIKIMLN